MKTKKLSLYLAVIGSVICCFLIVHIIFQIYRNTDVLKSSYWESDAGDVSVSIKTNELVSVYNVTGKFEGRDICLSLPGRNHGLYSVGVYSDRNTNEELFYASLEVKSFNKMLFYIDYQDGNDKIVVLRRK